MGGLLGQTPWANSLADSLAKATAFFSSPSCARSASRTVAPSSERISSRDGPRCAVLHILLLLRILFFAPTSGTRIFRRGATRRRWGAALRWGRRRRRRRWRRLWRRRQRKQRLLLLLLMLAGQNVEYVMSAMCSAGGWRRWRRWWRCRRKQRLRWAQSPVRSKAAARVVATIAAFAAKTCT